MARQDKLWVPQPASKGYGPNAETVRDQFVKQYGEATVMRGELSICLDLMILAGVVKPAEFVDALSRRLVKIDILRREAANLESDHK